MMNTINSGVKAFGPSKPFCLFLIINSLVDKHEKDHPRAKVINLPLHFHVLLGPAPYQVCYQAMYKACDNQMGESDLNKVELDTPSVTTYLST